MIHSALAKTKLVFFIYLYSFILWSIYKELQGQTQKKKLSFKRKEQEEKNPNSKHQKECFHTIT